MFLFRSPGFGLILVAESTTGALYSTEALGSGGMLPEKVGEIATRQILEEIYKVNNIILFENFVFNNLI